MQDAGELANRIDRGGYGSQKGSESYLIEEIEIQMPRFPSNMTPTPPLVSLAGAIWSGSNSVLA